MLKSSNLRVCTNIRSHNKGLGIWTGWFMKDFRFHNGIFCGILRCLKKDLKGAITKLGHIHISKKLSPDKRYFHTYCLLNSRGGGRTDRNDPTAPNTGLDA